MERRLVLLHDQVDSIPIRCAELQHIPLDFRLYTSKFIMLLPWEVAETLPYPVMFGVLKRYDFNPYEYTQFDYRFVGDCHEFNMCCACWLWCLERHTRR